MCTSDGFCHFRKSVDSTDFLTGFATGSINTLTVFAIGPAGSDEECAAVLALLIQHAVFLRFTMNLYVYICTTRLLYVSCSKV